MTAKNENNLAAILEKPQARVRIESRPIPTPGTDELVVRNHAIAANPADWKMQDYGYYITHYPTILGSDVCGVVTAVGSSVTKFKVGDRVTGFAGVIYINNPDHGAWQTYTVLREIATTRIPDSMSFEEGSVFPMAFATSAIALWANLGISRPTGEAVSLKSSILIWGASSSVGTAAVQLAKNSGLKIFSTASPVHHRYLKSLGVSEVFDYHDSDVVPKIVAAAKSADAPIRLGFDTITEGNTSKLASDVLVASGGQGSKLVLVLPWPEKDSKPDGIEISGTVAMATGTTHAELGQWLFNDYLQTALAKGTVVPAPKIEIVEGGLGSAQKVFDQLKAGVSGKKLVVKVD